MLGKQKEGEKEKMERSINLIGEVPGTETRTRKDCLGLGAWLTECVRDVALNDTSSVLSSCLEKMVAGME